MITVSRPRKIIRDNEARGRIGVGKTKWRDEYAPRLKRIKLGVRAFGYLESDIDELIDELQAESPTK